MKRITLICLLLCLIMVFTAGCQGNTPPETTAPTTLPPETTVPTTAAPDPAEIYQAALDALGTEGVYMKVDIVENMNVAGQTFTTEHELYLDYCNLNTEEFSARARRFTEIGSHYYAFEEVYSAGDLFQTIDGNTFRAKMDQEDFALRYPGIAFLDPALYTLTLEQDNTAIRFTAPTGVEDYFGGEEAELITAEGLVTLDEKGAAKKCEYTAEYQYGIGRFTVSATITYALSNKLPEIPENKEDYLLLEDIDAMWLLESAYGAILNAKQYDTRFLSTVQSQAAGLVVNTQQSISTYVTDSGTDYLVETGLYGMDASGTTEQDIKETYIDGVYVQEVDGEEVNRQKNISSSIFSDLASGVLMSNFLDSNVLNGGEITNLGSLLLVEYTAEDELGRTFSQNFSGNYLGDRNILDRLATEFTVNKLEYYLAVDRYTLLPTAIGYTFEGCHTIDGYDYLLYMQADQSFDLASITSHNTIYEEPSPDVEPENKPTPLFYKVTGQDGQQMWLFGTIHVGDDRTGFLPKEITDALISSDALAVECDTDGFDAQLEEDEKLMDTVSQLYFYSDGEIQTHLDTEDLYEDAIKAMRATGNYFYNSNYQKAALWSSSIDNYYLSQGHHLLSEKGVESRLEKIAEDNNIPLREVESSLFQLEMLTGYSDHLQEFQLYSSVYSHGKKNWEATAELYELWCAGDEAALAEEMAREPWTITQEDIQEMEESEDLTEEDLQDIAYIKENLEFINTELEKIYQEYVTSMEIDRNAGMLEVAIEYLESGETVFYAVGLAHLIAEDGLVHTLRDAGYTVEVVSFAG